MWDGRRVRPSAREKEVNAVHIIRIRASAHGALISALLISVLLIGACFSPDGEQPSPVPATATPTPTVSQEPTPEPTAIPQSTASPPATIVPTPIPSTPTALPEAEEWWTVAESTWNDTFEVTLEIFGASRITTQTELRVRTRLRNVSDDESTYIRWSQYDPAVSTWIVLPSGPPPADPRVRRAVRLIQLWAEGDPTPSLSSFPEVQADTLDAGDDIEREASWDLTVRGDSAGTRAPAPDGVYKVRADFYPRGGNEIPGLPEILLEFPITLDRGIGG